MAQYDDHRAYVRGSHFVVRARLSADGKTWAPAEVADISSGGLMLVSGADYPKGTGLWFELVLQGFLSEFEVKTEGEVLRKTPHGGGFQYGIRFKGLSQEKKIQIDENIRSDRPVSGGEYEAD